MRRTVATLLVVASPVLMAVPVDAGESRPAAPVPAAAAPAALLPPVPAAPAPVAAAPAPVAATPAAPVAEA
ncbi:MAG TPA: MarR family transcriptional regulator, partial [Acidimicrobiia bacterium]|nr:MarR family transcriptional regulator [Acidimicrobiia bacterium]